MSARMRGFTLIELLVAISIAAVLTGFAVTSYRDFQNSQALKQEGQTLISNLRYAQSQALGGVKKCGTEVLTGWFVTIETNRYMINSRCGMTSGTPKLVPFPMGITASSSLGVNSILFRPINQQVALINSSTGIVSNLTGDETVVLTKGTRTFMITIRRTGNIHEE